MPNNRLEPTSTVGLKNHWVFLKDYLKKYDIKGQWTYTLNSVDNLMTEGINIPVFITEPLVANHNVEYIRILLKHNKLKECLQQVISLLNHQSDIGISQRFSPVTLIDWLRNEMNQEEVSILDQSLATYRDMTA